MVVVRRRLAAVIRPRGSFRSGIYSLGVQGCTTGARLSPSNAAVHFLEMADETPDTDSPEIFDDLYLGLRAGGALRKQRRGQPLTNEERDALGRWQRLSVARKALALGGFSVGTFGLGFTLGGLVFGRWRKA